VARKKTALYDAGFFKDLLKRHPSVGPGLFKVVITFVNLKEEGGASNDRIRRTFLDILHYLLTSEKSSVKEQLASYH
jgi:hypothetical protein